MVVRDGKTESVVSVSTGATGNTPEGAFRIRWKALATTTWLGPAILYRTMTFLGNEYAIHGFPSVPAYAASHGCVRVRCGSQTGSTGVPRSASACTSTIEAVARRFSSRSSPS